MKKNKKEKERERERERRKKSNGKTGKNDEIIQKLTRKMETKN